jgi:protein-S-isoprenylcysteine O-methyltransferase Ste14
MLENERFWHYRPPKEIRALFIVHYAPLLLIVLTGPLTAFFGVFEMPTPKLYTVLGGVVLFLVAAYVYFSWEIFWYREYHGQLVTGGIFQKIRHPHYTSILIVGYGLALFFYSLFALVVATIAIPIMIWSIVDEEKLLVRQYGVEYQQYMKQVRWRIIPRVF